MTDGKIENWVEVDRGDTYPSPGFYAVLDCWNSEEGYFPGTSWSPCGGAVVPHPIAYRSPLAFATTGAALAWARENDPEW